MSQKNLIALIKEAEKRGEEFIRDGKKYSFRKNGSLLISSVNRSPSMVKPEFKDDCDINRIIKKFGNSARAFAALAPQTGSYADLTTVPDFIQMNDKIAKAYQAFETLPSKLQRRFRHDPKEFLEFLHDPNNKEEATKLGFFKKDETPKNETPKNETPPQTPPKETPPKN